VGEEDAETRRSPGEAAFRDLTRVVRAPREPDEARRARKRWVAASEALAQFDRIGPITEREVPSLSDDQREAYLAALAEYDDAQREYDRLRLGSGNGQRP
jgi:hypothetical protein